jgi:hypothetical protein
VGPDGEPTHISQSGLDYSGMRLEDFKHLCWEAFLHPDDFPETVKAFEHAIQTGTRPTRLCIAYVGRRTANIVGTMLTLSRCATERCGSSSGMACLLILMKAKRLKTGCVAAKPILRKLRS